jgi:uncharacterized protein (TIGR03435 family)
MARNPSSSLFHYRGIELMIAGMKCARGGMIGVNQGWWKAALAITFLAFHGMSLAQSPGPGAQGFEVATIKPSHYSPYSDNINYLPTFRAQNTTLQYLIVFAYHLASDRQLIGGPKWMNSAQFDIEAKEADSVTQRLANMPFGEMEDALRPMVQGLLADRFQLRVHHEEREMRVLALTVAKSGPRLQPSNIAADQAAPGGWLGLHSGHRWVEGREATMGFLASWLSGQPEIDGQILLDKTGLSGRYDFKMTWAPQRESSTDESGPSLFTALQEQLGLKLESVKAPVDVVVIDHVETPSPN